MKATGSALRNARGVMANIIAWTNLTNGTVVSTYFVIKWELGTQSTRDYKQHNMTYLKKYIFCGMGGNIYETGLMRRGNEITAICA